MKLAQIIRIGILHSNITARMTHTYDNHIYNKVRISMNKKTAIYIYRGHNPNTNTHKLKYVLNNIQLQQQSHNCNFGKFPTSFGIWLIFVRICKSIIIRYECSQINFKPKTKQKNLFVIYISDWKFVWTSIVPLYLNLKSNS